MELTDIINDFKRNIRNKTLTCRTWFIISQKFYSLIRDNNIRNMLEKRVNLLSSLAISNYHIKNSIQVDFIVMSIVEDAYSYLLYVCDNKTYISTYACSVSDIFYMAEMIGVILRVIPGDNFHYINCIFKSYRNFPSKDSAFYSLLDTITLLLLQSNALAIPIEDIAIPTNSNIFKSFKMVLNKLVIILQ